MEQISNMENKIDLVKVFELVLESDSFELDISTVGSTIGYRIKVNNEINILLTACANSCTIYSGRLFQNISKETSDRLIKLYYKKFEQKDAELLLNKFGEQILIKENENK